MVRRVELLNVAAPRPIVTSLPGLPVSRGMAPAAEELSRGFFAVGKEIDRRLDERVKFAAAQKGKREGAAGNITLREPDTLAGMSYNQAALQSYAATVEVRGRQKIKELYQEKWNQPSELAASLDGYRTATVKALGDLAPEAAQEFEARFRVWSQPYISRASDNHKTAFKQSYIDDSTNLEAEAIRDINQSAADLFDTNPERAQQAFDAIADTLATMRRATLQQAVGGDVPTPEAMQQREGKIFRNAIAYGVRDWFNKTPDKVDAYLKLKSGKAEFAIPDGAGNMVPVNLTKSMDSAQHGQLMEWVDQELAFSVQTAENAEKESDKAATLTRNLAEFDAWASVYSDDATKRITPAGIAALVQARRIDPEAGKQMLAELNSESAANDDGNTVMALENKIYAGLDAGKAIDQAQISKNISKATASRLRGLNNTQQTKGDETVNPRVTFRKLLASSAQTRGIMSLDLGGQNERVAEAMIEYDQLTQVENVAPEVAYRDVLERARVKSSELGIAETEAMLLPRFAVGGRRDLDIAATGKRLRAEFDAGRISQPELLQEIRRLKEWERVLGMLNERQAAKDSKKGKR